MGQETSFWRGPGKVGHWSKEIWDSLTIESHYSYRMGVEGKVFNGSVKELFSCKACVVARNRFVCLCNIYSNMRKSMLRGKEDICLAVIPE